MTRHSYLSCSYVIVAVVVTLIIKVLPNENSSFVNTRHYGFYILCWRWMMLLFATYFFLSFIVDSIMFHVDQNSFILQKSTATFNPGKPLGQFLSTGLYLLPRSSRHHGLSFKYLLDPQFQVRQLELLANG